MNDRTQYGRHNSRKLAVIMDPIEGIQRVKDSTLAMLLAAEERQWQIWYGELGDIWLRDGEAYGDLKPLSVVDNRHSWYDLGKGKHASLGEMDVILMRKDPPFDMEYVQATYILERAENCGALVVNRPRALRDANEKTFVSWFPQCSPPTLISRSMDELRGFVDGRERSVLKPLNGMGGWSVFVTSPDDGNLNVLLETLTGNGARYIMAQQYVDAISETGDKRILLIDGEPVPYALARIPEDGDHRGNLACGARARGQQLTQRDRWICSQLAPELRERGIIFAGIDVIGDYLTEINVTSPTCIRELDRLFDLNIGATLVDALESKLNKRKPGERDYAAIC